MIVRTRTVIFHNEPTVLQGPELKPGDKAPDYKLQSIDFTDVTLAQSQGNVRLLSVVVSLDTPVCDLQTQRFEEEAARFESVVIYTVSMDLPYAQSRYCGAHSIRNLKTLSDHRDASFGQAYGVLMEGPRLLSRAIFIIDSNDIIRYVEYVPVASNHPDYDKALTALEKIIR
jgi:thioredoxin-dependent peroxiredoxin